MNNILLDSVLSVQAAITKIPWHINKRNLFLNVLKAECLRSGCQCG